MTTTFPKATREQRSHPWMFPEVFELGNVPEATPAIGDAIDKRLFDNLEAIAKSYHLKVNFWHEKRSGMNRVYLNNESGEAVMWQELNGGRQSFIHRELRSESLKSQLRFIIGLYIFELNKFYHMMEKEEKWT
jgi:hypothetical protein